MTKILVSETNLRDGWRQGWITSQLISARLGLFWLIVILRSQKASSARLVYELKLGHEACEAGIKKYTKYNIYIYLKLENSNNTKVTHPTALNRTKYLYVLTYIQV